MAYELIKFTFKFKILSSTNMFLMPQSNLEAMYVFHQNLNFNKDENNFKTIHIWIKNIKQMALITLVALPFLFDSITLKNICWENTLYIVCA